MVVVLRVDKEKGTSYTPLSLTLLQTSVKSFQVTSIFQNVVFPPRISQNAKNAT